MFHKLLNLYSKNSKKTPLEDFTTEILVGVLNNDKKLKYKFCNDFLKLKSKRISISTQKYYFLEDDINCIVDIVIEGNLETCFIENKVNSKEGYNQLERYSKILNKIKDDKNVETKLCYCTKKYDKKKIKEHSFYQFHWHDIANFIKDNSSEKLTHLFIKFLKDNDMTNDMIITANDIMTLENINKTLTLLDRNIDNVLPLFKEKFGKIIDCRNGKKMKEQLSMHNRYCVAVERITRCDGYSEILFGFETNGKIYTQIYLDADNKFYNKFIEIGETKDEFIIEHFEDYGSRIYLEKNIGDLLNEINSENEIKKWFTNSFNKIEKFMSDTKDIIKWKKNIA